ncbi:MAG: LysM peptidoglycan-binding domain-containing protein [Candidatus Omnitrophica bacterium]|nr:LysM peptidoglycan-binding domain-containing protein [Candidatus Omnitrophota bacterium]
MKKNVLLLAIFLLSGCLVRTYTIRKPRTDLDLTGNRGYLAGTSSASEDLTQTRPHTIFEVEFGPTTEKKTEYIKETQTRRASRIETNFSSRSPESGESAFSENDVFKEPVAPEEELVYPEEEFTLYTVQKGDTLQKISKKFYGTTRKWKMLFNENEAALKSPDKIRPGIKLKVPLFN